MVRQAEWPVESETASDSEVAFCPFDDDIVAMGSKGEILIISILDGPCQQGNMQVAAQRGGNPVVEVIHVAADEVRRKDLRIGSRDVKFVELVADNTFQRLEIHDNCLSKNAVNATMSIS